MPNGNGANKSLIWWLLGILGSLITAGVIAAVGLGWGTSQSVGRVETKLEAVETNLERHDRTMERVERKLDNHIQQHISGGGGPGAGGDSG